MVPFYGWNSTFSRPQRHYEEAVYFLPVGSQKFLLLIWSTWEGWKAELTLEPYKGLVVIMFTYMKNEIVKLRKRKSHSCQQNGFQENSEILGN